jgi:hypothetical protein
MNQDSHFDLSKDDPILVSSRVSSRGPMIAFGPLGNTARVAMTMENAEDLYERLGAWIGANAPRLSLVGRTTSPTAVPVTSDVTPKLRALMAGVEAASIGRIGEAAE